MGLGTDMTTATTFNNFQTSHLPRALALSCYSPVEKDVLGTRFHAM